MALRPAHLLSLTLLSTPICMAQTEAAADYAPMAEAITEGWMAKNAPQSLDWNWPDAVMLLGAQAVHQRTQNPAILNYLQTYVDFHIERGYRINRSDTVVPATSALYLWEMLGDTRYLEPVDACHTYLENNAPRLDDGSLAHTAFTPDQIWMDSLFMLGTFYTMDATRLDNPQSFEAITTQFTLFNSHLNAPNRNLYWHMYHEGLDQHMPLTPTFWGRGNGWVLASLALLLTDLPADHAERSVLEGYFTAHAQAIIDLQDASGRWHTVLNRSESYLETSATALFAFGLLRGHALGLLGPDALSSGELALTGLMDSIVYDEADYPVITEISKATIPGPYRYYANIPTGEDEAYGVGAVLLALEEAHALGL